MVSKLGLIPYDYSQICMGHHMLKPFRFFRKNFPSAKKRLLNDADADNFLIALASRHKVSMVTAENTTYIAF